MGTMMQMSQGGEGTEWVGDGRTDNIHVEGCTHRKQRAAVLWVCHTEGNELEEPHSDNTSNL